MGVGNCDYTMDGKRFGRLILTPKGPRPILGPFLKFGQAIVDAIFVQKISNFR
jgi:hypothetical protein